MERSLLGLIEPARTRLHALVRGVLAAALPVGCAACGAALDEAHALSLCGPCDAGLVDLGEPFCLDCARTGGAPRRCPARAHLRLAGGFVWNESIRAPIHALKFGDAPELAQALVARAWAGAAFRARPRPDLVAAIPLHPVRRRERGYDQAALLARAFAHHAGAPDVAALVRTRPTRQQARLKARARAENLAGAFRVVEPGWVRGRHVALVDDVATTGATLDAAAKALVIAGARRVEAWTIAYEPLE
jgi:ComF family protein